MKPLSVTEFLISWYPHSSVYNNYHRAGITHLLPHQPLFPNLVQCTIQPRQGDERGTDIGLEGIMRFTKEHFCSL